MDEAERAVRIFLGRSYDRQLAHARAVGLVSDVPDLAPHEAAAILWYTSNASTRLLRRLREGRVRRLDARFTEVLERALARLPVYEGPTIHRIIRVAETEEAEFRRAYRSGAEPHWAVLAGCSAGRNIRNEGNVRFVITHLTGRWIGPYSWHPNEEEVVLLSGRRFRSRAFVKVAHDEIEVELEELVS